MNKKIFIITFAALLSLVSCWREDLSDCWKDNVSLIFTVEKFQTPPEGESASVMSELLDFFDYYLFKIEGTDMIPVDSGRIEKEKLGNDSFELDFNELPFGDYVIAAVANNDNGFTNVKDTSNLKVRYSEPYENNNYYVSIKTFTVDCYCNFTDFVKLYNTQGELEIRFSNLPDNIIGADVAIDNVYSICSTDTIYSDNQVIKTYVAKDKDAENSINLDLFTFPTTEQQKSTVTITLYMDVYNGEPVVASVYHINDIEIKRNQTSRISEDFKGSIVTNPDFDISINPDWDGVNDGGGNVEI